MGTVHGARKEVSLRLHPNASTHEESRAPSDSTARPGPCLLCPAELHEHAVLSKSPTLRRKSSALRMPVEYIVISMARVE